VVRVLSGLERLERATGIGRAARFVRFVRFVLPIKAEQVQRLNEDKVFDHRDAAEDFGYRPRTFREGIQLEIEEMRQAGWAG
jgi:hypothetical protein